MTSPSAPRVSDDLLQEVLRRFGVTGGRTTLVRQGDNTVYRVDLPEGSRLALRLHTAGRHPHAALRAESAWLAYLARHLPGIVPSPCCAPDGAFMLDAADAGPRCSLLRWVEGVPLDEGVEFTARQAAQAGVLLATIHRLAERFVPDADFHRPLYDAAYFRQCGVALRDRLPTTAWSAQRSNALQANVDALVTQLGDWAALPGGRGLIHADAHPGNFVTRGDALGLLDWDRCGFGPFLLDLAGVTLALEEPERVAFLTSYARVRPLPEGVAQPLRTLRVLAAVENLSVLAQRSQEHPFVLDALGVLERVVADVPAE